MKTPIRKTERRWANAGFLLIILVSWLSYFCISCLAQEPTFPGLKVICTTDDPHGTKILFIGNSFTYVNDAPGIFAWMLKKQQPKYHFQLVSFALPSYSLLEHAQR